MKATAEQSAELKMALKHDRVTPLLEAEAMSHLAEVDEAIEEVRNGWDTAEPGSWVAEYLAAMRR